MNRQIENPKRAGKPVGSAPTGCNTVCWSGQSVNAKTTKATEGHGVAFPSGLNLGAFALQGCRADASTKRKLRTMPTVQAFIMQGFYRSPYEVDMRPRLSVPLRPVKRRPPELKNGCFNFGGPVPEA